MAESVLKKTLRADTSWHPARWRHFPVAQHPGWPDDARLRTARDHLGATPPLVSPEEIVTLRRQLTEVAFGHGVVLQAGDCAETFEPATADRVSRFTALIGQASGMLGEALHRPVISIGRIAGQFAKPRSAPIEVVDDVALPAFRGFLVNGDAADPVVRCPDPGRMIEGYRHAAGTLALLRRTAAEDLPTRGYRRDGLPALWTSHEALVLDYEEPLTRWVREMDAWALTSTHLPWVGERTRHVDGAHVQFLAGVLNPVGCKVGPATTPADIAALAAALDPDRQPGRLVLIARMGADRVDTVLPRLVETVRRAGHLAVWLCDPMHGNTIRARSGAKTRQLGSILAEINGFVRAMQRAGARPGGLHLESTADPVTECLGGRCAITEDQLSQAYLTACDPRLNADQTLEVAQHFAELLRVT